VQLACLPGGELTAVLLDFGEGRGAHFTLLRAPSAAPGWRLQVVAERGAAAAERGGLLTWSDDEGDHSLRMSSAARTGEQVLTAFREVVLGGRSPWPSLADASGVLGWLRQDAACPPRPPAAESAVRGAVQYG
jgi:hypothetical protein